MGLFYLKESKQQFLGYDDVGYLSDPHKARSQTEYVFKTPKGILLGLFPIMKPKIQLSTHDVEFQRQKQAKSDRTIIDSPRKNSRHHQV